MDPNANWEEQLRLAQAILDGDGEQREGEGLSQDADRLAELVLALNDWIRGGGFPPAAWSKHAGNQM